MTTTAELHRLIKASMADSRLEPDFLRALLAATLFIHRPLEDDVRRARVITFKRPDGLSVVPVFTDEARAASAGQGVVRITPVLGRDLFRSMPDATFMLDPNDVSTTLYPEELAALLRDGTAVPAPTPGTGLQVDLSEAPQADRWIADAVVACVRAIDAAEALYLAQMHQPPSRDPSGFLLVVAVPDALAERVARSMSLVLQTMRDEPRLPVDIAWFEPDDVPAWICTLNLTPVWSRSGAGPCGA